METLEQIAWAIHEAARFFFVSFFLVTLLLCAALAQ